MVPLNSSEEILVGSINHLTGIVTNLHTADVEITSSEDDCIMELKWTKKDRQNFNLLVKKYMDYQKIPIFDYEKDPMCKVNQPINGTPEQQYLAWQGTLKKSGDLVANRIFEVISYLKPVTEPMNPAKVKLPFMSNATVGIRNNQIYLFASHFNGKTLPWIATEISFDTEGMLHGYCSFQLERAYFNQTGTHDFLNWSMKSFSGRFLHGKLEGLVLIQTWRGVILFVEFKDGQMHGRAHAIGQKFIFDAEVKLYIEN